MGDVSAAAAPIAQAQERLTKALAALDERHVDQCLEHLRRVEEIARFARYVVEAAR